MALRHYGSTSETNGEPMTGPYWIHERSIEANLIRKLNANLEKWHEKWHEKKKEFDPPVHK